VGSREPEPRDPGFRARGRLQATGPRRLHGVVVILAGIVIAGLAFAALDDANPPTSSDAAVASTPAGSPSPLGTILATPIPRAAVLGAPAPMDPIPINAGWLQWLDPASGSLSADAPTNDGSFQLAFVDTHGRAIQICVQAPVLGAGSWRFEIDLCPFDETGSGGPHVGIATFEVPAAFATSGTAAADWPVQHDAAVSPDGQWLWLATAVRTDVAVWSVEVSRVDLATRTVVATEALPDVRLRASTAVSPRPGEWMVGTSAVIRPIVRVSPSGRRLSLTLDGEDHASDAMVAADQRRLVLDAALDPRAPVIDVPRDWLPPDETCDGRLSGWVTDDAYVTACMRIIGGITGQRVVRIEDAAPVARDVEIGPSYPLRRLYRAGPSWLLNSRLGAIVEWDPDALALSTVDVATGVSTTLQLATSGPLAPGPIVLPPGGTAPNGSLAWSELAPAGSDRGGLQMTASGDGRYIFLAAQPPEGGFPGRTGTEPRSLLWVIDATSDAVVGRGDAPAVIDQLAQGPRGRQLLLMPTPPLQDPQQITTDWVVPVWFVDPATGETVAVDGQVHGPGSQPGWLLSPTVGSLAGF
jgi:hypothetical protein